MSAAVPQFATTLSLSELEALIYRIVKEAVHEEFANVLRQLPASIVADWTHEGPDDPAGDQMLLAEALAERDRYRADPAAWMDWEAFKSELKAAEAAGKLPGGVDGTVSTPKDSDTHA